MLAKEIRHRRNGLATNVIVECDPLASVATPNTWSELQQYTVHEHVPFDTSRIEDHAAVVAVSRMQYPRWFCVIGAGAREAVRGALQKRQLMYVLF